MGGSLLVVGQEEPTANSRCSSLEVCLAIRDLSESGHNLGKPCGPQRSISTAHGSARTRVLFLDLNKRIAKYQWIRALQEKQGSSARELRESIKTASSASRRSIPRWEMDDRKALVAPRVVESVEALQLMAMDGVQTIGYVALRAYPSCSSKTGRGWSSDKAGMLTHTPLF